MPMFDFHCPACGKTFEELLASGDMASPRCPHCGAAGVQRLLSAPSPLKTGAFPFKPGPVRPMGRGAPSCGTGGCGTGGCGH